MKLITGTDKGLIIHSQNSGGWKLDDIAFMGLPIGAFHQDVGGTWWVAVNHKHWGAKLYRSSNHGESFKEIECPKFGAESPYSLKSIWTINSQYVGARKQVYIGTEPAALFVSENNGESFEELSGLTEHPSRPTWQGGGKGSNSPFLHSIVFHPESKNHLMVGISCAGVFQSQDAGKTWKATNNGLQSFFLPDVSTEVGHDPHILLRHPLNSQIIWQQNHCGVYRSEDGGNNWKDISDPQGKAVYGFAMAIDEKDTETAWVIPAQSDDLRIPFKNQLAVYTTQNAGKSWVSQRNGLPQSGAFDLVLRAGFSKKEATLAFGSNNGNLYLSEDLGESWSVLSQSLSTVRCVSFSQ